MKGDSSKHVGHPMIGIDRLVHEPARLLILSYLSVMESADFLFIIRQTEITAGNLSSHLNKLEAAGYVKITKKFKEKKPVTVLALTKKGRIAFESYRDMMKQFFESLPG